MLTPDTTRPHAELKGPGYRAMSALSRATHDLPLDPLLRELLRVRASMLNGCAYCVDMHTKDARAVGETEQRLYAVARRRHRGRTTWVWEVDIADDAGRLCALVRMTVAVRDLPA